ncbi:MAG: sigma-70 family RNA polymerase sigma factor [Rikenellaceae bacterium]
MDSEDQRDRSESLFKQFSAAIKGFINKHTSLSSLEAEDMLQDIFYKFIVADGEHQLIENTSAWLYRTSRNLIIDKSRKIREERIDSSKNILLIDNSYESNPESEIINTMIEEEIEAALASLPHEQRVVFELNQLQGISFKDISESSGISINTLISRKRYAILHLRKELKELYDELFEC